MRQAAGAVDNLDCRVCPTACAHTLRVATLAVLGDRSADSVDSSANADLCCKRLHGTLSRSENSSRGEQRGQQHQYASLLGELSRHYWRDDLVRSAARGEARGCLGIACTSLACSRYWTFCFVVVPRHCTGSVARR